MDLTFSTDAESGFLCFLGPIVLCGDGSEPLDCAQCYSYPQLGFWCHKPPQHPLNVQVQAQRHKSKHCLAICAIESGCVCEKLMVSAGSTIGISVSSTIPGTDADSESLRLLKPTLLSLAGYFNTSAVRQNAVTTLQVS